MSASSPEQQFFLGRQPILDREQRLVAYELLFRAGHHNAANVTDGLRATATVIANAFSELSIGDALGNRRGFINVDEAFLFSDLFELLPRQSVVLEILETVPPSPEVIRRCRELRAQGFTLALDDVVQVTPEYRELLELVEIVKVDIQPLKSTEIVRLTEGLHPLGKQLLAEKVDSREQMEFCMRLGYALFQGYYFARPTVIAGRKLQHSELSLMKLLNLLLTDADTAALEAELKQQPGLSVNLLRMANSAGMGTTTHIASLGHAIAVLGRRQLQRWLQLLLFASSSPQGTASPLLQLAATRGRLLELLAAHLRPGDSRFADLAFMVGITSLMPALIGVPISDIVAPLGMPPEARAALCEGRGLLGRLLHLAASSEGDSAEGSAALLEDIPELDAATLSRSLTQALAWASGIGQEAAA